MADKAYYKILAIGGNLDGHKFLSYAAACTYANRVYGVGNWTMEIYPKNDGR